MKYRVLLILLLLFTITATAQVDQLLFGKKGFYSYDAITGKNSVIEDEAAIYGSDDKTRSSKQDTSATRINPQKWMIWYKTDSLATTIDSLPGLFVYLIHLAEETEYTYYQSLLVAASDGDTDYYKGADSTFTTQLVGGLFTENGESVLYSNSGSRLYAKPEGD